MDIDNSKMLTIINHLYSTYDDWNNEEIMDIIKNNSMFNKIENILPYNDIKMNECCALGFIMFINVCMYDL